MFACILKLKSSMKISIATSKILNNLNDNIFSLINAVCFLLTLMRCESIGTYTSIIIIVYIFLNKEVLFSNKDQLFKLFVVFNLFSGFAYLFNDRSVIIFFQSISYNLIPSLLYFLGAKQCRLNVSQEYIANKILYPAVLLMGIGLFFYFLFPDFYFSNIGQDLATYKWGRGDYRFGSYISSSNLGSLCVSCIPLYFITIKTRPSLYNSIILIVILISLALCMQRSAWAVSLLFLTILILRTSKPTIIFSYLIILLIVFFLGAYFIGEFFTEEQFNYMLTRLSDLNFQQMSSERGQQWQAAINIFVENPWGYGLGSLGHKAAESGFTACADGNYFKTLAELGIIAFLMFMSMIYKALTTYFKNSFLSLVILGFAFQAIGSNVFDLYFSSYVFWYILGYLNVYYSQHKGNIMKF